MKSQQNKFALRLSVVAVQSAMVAMTMASAALAQQPTVEELITPTSTIDVGVVDMNDKSAKFGEYNGLQKKGMTPDVNFDVRTNGANDMDPTRFRAAGNNLGRETRDVNIEYGQQGSFRLNFGYDELRHNISDSYQTPYIGVGTNTLTMPSTWIKPTQQNVNPNATTPVVPGYNANALSPAWIANDTIYRFNNATNSNAGGSVQAAYAATPAQQAAMQATAANDNALFRSVDLYTKRTKYGVGGEFILDKQWSFSANATQESKVGLKPKSYIPSSSETVVVMPDPINEDHNQINLAANFRDDKSFMTAAYYGSFYRNRINGVTVEEIQGRNLAVAGQMSASATAPSNEMHQFNLTAGYTFMPGTKLVGDVAYSRNTQDQSYLTNSLPTTAAPAALGGSWLPTNNLHGLVVTKSLDLKLTHKQGKDLNLAAAYKYNDRHNETPVNTYFFQDVDTATSGNSIWNAPLGFPASALGGAAASGSSLGGTTNNGAILANRAFSKKINQLNLDADYHFTKAQTVKLGYDWQKVERYCDGSWIDCAAADATKESTLRAEYRFKPVEDLSGRFAYAYSQRRASAYNTNAWLALAPMANVVPDQNLLSTGGYSAYQTMQMFGLTAWGPQTSYPGVVPLGTANPGQGYTAAQWASALGITTAQATTQLNTLNALSKAQWGMMLNLPAASISDRQLAALNQYFALGNKLSGAAVGTRNFLSMMPGQQTPMDGDRNRDKLRAALNWQASEKFSLVGGFDYNRDNYSNTSSGLMEGKSVVLNFDGAYQVTDEFSSNLFFTHEDRKTTTAGPGTGTNADGSAAATGTVANTAAGSLVGCGLWTSNAQELRNARVDSCLNWQSEVTDKVNTLGLNLRHKGLMKGKLDLSGSASYTRAVTTQSFPMGGVYVSTLQTVANFGAAGATTWSRTFVPAAAMPDVTSKIITLSISGKYNLDKSSAIRAAYTYQNLKYDDWMYYNNVAGVVPSGSLPSNQSTPTYTIHGVGVAYIYSFH